VRFERSRRCWPVSGATAAFVLVIAMLLFGIMPRPALAADPASRSATQENARFASLVIEIWPEFDRRATLVILKGELPADLALPAAVSLRIPASSGGPSAVAFGTAARGELFNLAYDRADADDFITLRFKAAQRFVHIEFYDLLATGAPDRRYTYVWPGDLAVDQLSVRVQEPAAASNVSVQPDLGTGFAGPDGLVYRTAALGALDAGRQLSIDLRYTRTESRTSAEILNLNAPESASQATTDSVQVFPRWLLLVVVIIVALVALTGVAALWWHRRRKALSAGPGSAFCPQCGNRLISGSRFCSTCGTPVRNG
jgi:hypothetical protein